MHSNVARPADLFGELYVLQMFVSFFVFIILVVDL